MRRYIIQTMGTVLFLSLALIARAQSDCLAMAETFYEQVYCEVQAQNRHHGLPPIYEFKRNDETTQALLLRRPARKLGIDVPMPRSKTAPSPPPRARAPAPSKGATADVSDTRREAAPPSRYQALSECSLNGARIQCPDKQYQLLGNQSNDDLAPGALEPSNKMDLPVFDGELSEHRAVQAYLHEAYERYVEKMLAIGLGGVTTSYGRFVFLFEDIQSKDLDFSDRFETMYRFLKKDKASMAVNTTPTSDKELQIEDCDPLNAQLLVCSRQGRNYVFRAE